jgi:hypothetical protein
MQPFYKNSSGGQFTMPLVLQNKCNNVGDMRWHGAFGYEHSLSFKEFLKHWKMLRQT